MPEPLIFELSASGRVGCDFPDEEFLSNFDCCLPDDALRQFGLALPEVDELTLVRHFTRLSQMNYSVDTNFYPLGSCTMKYNPKVNEEIAALPGLSTVHPLQDTATCQGVLQIMFELQEYLREISGLPGVTLQPAAGAQGEFTSLLMMRAYFEREGQGCQRKRIIVPDSAHGTNPASAARCGYFVTQIPSGSDGCVDLAAVDAALRDDVVCLMVTNPNTLGVFEKEIEALADRLHAVGAFLYLDGANMNAIMGKAKPGLMGCDVMHFNLHKTYSTPHGGGGPGAGPVAVAEKLIPYLPVPTVVKAEETYVLDYDRPHTIGRLHASYGNVGVLIRAHAYITQLGGEGLTRVSEDAVLNANYLLSQVDVSYRRTCDAPCKHEFVLSASDLKRRHSITALDVAKRLLDYGFYAPTIYFPLIVKEAIMVEPTETESRETLDRFAEALNDILKDSATAPDTVRGAPHQTPVRRLEEAKAAREMNLCFSAACETEHETTTI
ncbi:MAG: glycine dehydrogenase (aminomethyl-transferring) [Armatimonadetes bacterium CG_4_8_14_3_um_filter_58_9]|nr:MAG: glycine dehydrogenase (aminomethyl-transferring) [Armatimonadetes bacterium CG_4_8_14_3_um_filter_58_9]